MRAAARVAALTAFIFIRAPAQQLPGDLEPGSFDVEPAVLPGNLIPDQPNQPATDLGQLERKLARAREAAAGADRLFRIGVLAKVEAENRVMRVVKLEAEVTQARLASVQLELDLKEQRHAAGEATEAEVEAARSELKQAEEAAAVAVANQKKAELDAASLNVARRQKLLALGSGGKAALRRAEEKLAELKGNSQ